MFIEIAVPPSDNGYTIETSEKYFFLREPVFHSPGLWLKTFSRDGLVKIAKVVGGREGVVGLNLPGILGDLDLQLDVTGDVFTAEVVRPYTSKSSSTTMEILLNEEPMIIGERYPIYSSDKITIPRVKRPSVKISF